MKIASAQRDNTARGSENSRGTGAIRLLSPEFRCFNNVIRFVNSENTPSPARHAPRAGNSRRRTHAGQRNPINPAAWRAYSQNQLHKRQTAELAQFPHGRYRGKFPVNH